MSEYIKRDTALKIIDNYAKTVEEKNSQAAIQAVRDIVAVICPVEDVAPVIHGCWKNIGGDEWCCNCCGYVKTTESRNDRPAYKFCPDCGARMDGDSNDC